MRYTLIIICSSKKEEVKFLKNKKFFWFNFCFIFSKTFVVSINCKILVPQCDKTIFYEFIFSGL
jgi:hypothetical protein